MRKKQCLVLKRKIENFFLLLNQGLKKNKQNKLNKYIHTYINEIDRMNMFSVSKSTRTVLINQDL